MKESMMSSMSTIVTPSIRGAIKLTTTTRTASKLRLHSLSWFKSITFQPIVIVNTPTTTTTRLHSLSSSSSTSSSDLPPKLQEIVSLFQATQDPRAKYQQLLFYATQLPPLADTHKTKDNKVEGCVSQVWVRAVYNSDEGAVYYEADSDSVMTKGLAALLVMGLSGQPVAEIVRVRPDFVTLLGLQQNLTPSRNNGFLNMLKLMQRKALLLGLGLNLQRENSEVGFDQEAANGVERLDLDGNSDVNGVESLNRKVVLGRRGERIREVLERELRPTEIEIEDISYQHAGHAGVRGNDDGETHFNLKVVSSEFEGKSLVKRHRMIYGLLQDELQSGLHALSIVAKTPSEVVEDT